MMVLETLENNNNSLIVFSRNIFSREANFRMIFKKDPSRVQRKLLLYDICGILNHPVPKNLIVYRLLTNIEGLRIINPQYGCYINLGNTSELIYTDPVYAIKELEAFAQDKYIPTLRFRIQQAGFTTSEVLEDGVIFKEVFHFDLDSAEAQAQNDLVFVEALLKDDTSSADSYYTEDETAFPISEDNEYKDRKVSSAFLLNSMNEDEEVSLSSLAGIKKEEAKMKHEETKSGSKKTTEVSLFKIFKSGESLKEYIGRKRTKKIILRFKK